MSLNYLKKLFPITTWIGRYNYTWLVGDVLAGLTIGMIVVPQSLAYAKIIGVPIQHGLYSSFVGVTVYMFFATSKDVTIGPSAVVTLLTAQTVAAQSAISDEMGIVPFVCTTAFIVGFLELLVGFLRLGMLVDFISGPTIAGFTTGAAISTQISQLPSLFGIVGVDNYLPAYNVLYNTLRHADMITCDAAVGLGVFFFLVSWKMITLHLIKRQVPWGPMFGNAGNIVSIIIFTSIAAFVNQAIPGKIKIFGFIPRGLNYLKVPQLVHLGSIFPSAATICLVAIIEHIAVTKSFGRQNGYKIDPNQEIIALGVINFLGPFCGAFPTTGSFSRSAVQSRSGVFTPLAGIFTSAVVLISIYFLTSIFSQIPTAALAAIICFNLISLICSWEYIKGLYTVDKLDLLVFALSFGVQLFSNIQTGIYASVAFSMCVMLYKICRPTVISLVRVKSDTKSLWIDGASVSDPKNEITPPPIGVAVFRVEESITFSNSSHISSMIYRWILAFTYAGDSGAVTEKDLWCKGTQSTEETDLTPLWPGSNSKQPLKHLVLDMCCVANMDSTGLQSLIDTRKDLSRHFGYDVKWTFAHVKQHLSGYLLQFEREFEDCGTCYPDVDAAVEAAGIGKRDSFFEICLIK
jgi:sodium-independent sulfate anion transporter 11